MSETFPPSLPAASSKRPSRAWMAWLGWAVALGLIVWDAFLVYELKKQPGLPSAPAGTGLPGQPSPLSDLVDAYLTIPLRGTDGQPATARLFLLPDNQRAVLAARNLPLLAPSEYFFIWLVKGGETVPAGKFLPDAAGAALVAVKAPEAMKNYLAATITRETSDNAPAPAGPIVLAGQFPN